VDFLPIAKDVGCCTSAIFGNSEVNDSCMEVKLAERYNITRASLRSRGCLLDVSEGKQHNFHTDAQLLEPENFRIFDEVKASMMKHDIFHSKSFLFHLKTMEENLLRDIYYKQILFYRGLPEAHTIPLNKGIVDSPSMSDPDPKLKWLMTYSCNLCKGQRITMVDWNQLDVNVLAVGYEIRSSSNEDETARGMVLIWSLNNPTYPQHTIHVESNVTCLAFSSERPLLLSVGTENGLILLYEICQPGQHNLLHPVADSSFSFGTSKSAILQLKWKCKIMSNECKLNADTRTTDEFLYSVSSDGEVIEWSTEKGLYISSTLMKFKHVSTCPACLRTTMGALCLAFLSSYNDRSHDEQSYLVGTEDGKIHRCNFTNTEHPLESLDCHEAPVNRILYHPNVPGRVLSCSEDGFVKVWSNHGDGGTDNNEGMLREEKVFRPEDLWDSVNDISWSFADPNIFASVTEDGRLLLYDVSETKSDPILTQYSTRDGSNLEKESLSKLTVDGKETAIQLQRTHFTEQLLTTKGDNTRLPALTCVSFHRLCPVLVVGDAIGNVTIFRC
jgi:WD40 repeat protein